MRAERDPQAIARNLEAFLAAEPRIRVVEEDKVRLQLAPRDSGYSVLGDGGKTVLHLWSREGSLVRRVVELRQERRRLRLGALRLGQTRSHPLWLEATGARSEQHNQRRAWRARLLEEIERAWRPWRPEGAPAPAGEVELLLLASRLGHCVVAAVPEAVAAGDRALAALLLWARDLRRLGRIADGAWLHLIVPEALAAAAQLRVAALRAAARIAVFTWHREAGLRPATPLDWGNLESLLPPARPEASPGPPPAPWAALIAKECPAAAWHCGAEGRLRCDLHGLTFLRQHGAAERCLARFEFAVFAAGPPSNPRFRPLLPETEAAFAAQLRQLARQRQPEGDASSPLYQLRPEAWLEEVVCRHMERLEPRCDRRFLYRQVPSFCRQNRDVLDLLAVERDGRLVVFELKASEASGFPLQALDYWQRVCRHLAAGEFRSRGYFPGLDLRPEPPRLVLVAPALRWPARLSELLEEFDPSIEVTLVGLNEQWRRQMLVVQRETPGGGAAGGDSAL